jgi:hypothetical protein
MSSNFETMVERVIQHYTSPEYREDVSEAKNHFQEVAGSFDEAAADFEAKMAQFTDWYVFTRKLKRVGAAPVEYCLEDPKYKMTPSERPLYFCLRNSRHSLFEFVKVRGNDVYVRDLFTSFEYIIRNSKVTIGFQRDELFEARLIPYENEFVFSGSFCLHPRQVSKFITQEIRKVNRRPENEYAKSREELMSRLFKMKHKHEQYKHLDIHEIYSNESKLRI